MTCRALIVLSAIAALVGHVLAQESPALAKVDEVFEPWELPEPEDNGYDDLVRAFWLLQDEDEVAELLDLGRLRDEPATEILADNAEALETLREALGKECVAPRVASFGAQIPQLGPGRDMARLLAVKGIDCEMRGEYAAAYDCYLDAFRLGQALNRGGVLIHRLMQYAIADIALSNIRVAALTTDTPAAVLRSVREQLEELGAKDATLQHTLAYDLFGTARAVLEVVDGKLTMKEFEAFVGELDADAVDRGIDVDTEMAAIVGCYSRAIGLADVPYADTGGLVTDPKDYETPVAGLVLPALDSLFERDARYRTGLQATCLVLALEAYFRDTGKAPDVMDELVPGYIDEIPLDPYSSAPFAYVTGPRKGDYLLYSFGRDLEDNGGDPELDLAFGPMAGEE